MLHALPFYQDHVQMHMGSGLKQELKNLWTLDHFGNDSESFFLFFIFSLFLTVLLCPRDHLHSLANDVGVCKGGADTNLVFEDIFSFEQMLIPTFNFQLWQIFLEQFSSWIYP